MGIGVKGTHTPDMSLPGSFHSQLSTLNEPFLLPKKASFGQLGMKDTFAFLKKKNLCASSQEFQFPLQWHICKRQEFSSLLLFFEWEDEEAPQPRF